ncbi:MAG: hypothetical protein H8E26_02400 [FCB group bacterium]|nr:hypothetical protein [FCB group bacterium]MBL7027383.1 hypothetical protein [Candidatus Neomarinimicrobiota bacterium]MBL7122666.1 hypothetical protein [Candidatus Neomarinimicrobiota bacterium]
MSSNWHFPVLIMVSLVAFVGILRLVLHGRTDRPPTQTVLWVATVVVVGGMSFAKLGASTGLPVWVYYGVPAVLTWALPSLVFRMRAPEFGQYLILAVLMAPVIHILFSFFLGWKEYMPFIPVPSLVELLGR